MKKHLFNMGLSLALTLSACTVPINTGLSSPHAWIDSPLPGSVIHPPNPCQIVAHGASNSGIAIFELSINGVVSASFPSPDPAGTLVRLTQDCGLAAPGRYLLQVRALDKAGKWSNLAETNVTIVEGEIPTPTPTLTPTETTIPNVPASATPTPTATLTPSSTATPTNVPTPTHTNTPVPSASIERMRVSTASAYYALSGSVLSIACGDLSVTILVKATDPLGITVVMLFYRLQSQSSGLVTDFTPLVMTPVGKDLYQIAFTPQTLFSDSLIRSYGVSWLQYQVVIQNKAGQANTRTQVFSDLTLKMCTR